MQMKAVNNLTNIQLEISPIPSELVLHIILWVNDCTCGWVGDSGHTLYGRFFLSQTRMIRGTYIDVKRKTNLIFSTGVLGCL